MAEELFPSTSYFYRMVGRIEEKGIYTQNVVKYFATKKQAQNAIKEERTKGGFYGELDDVTGQPIGPQGHIKVSLWLEKVILKNSKESITKLLNEEISKLDPDDMFLQLSDGDKQMASRHIAVQSTFTY